MPKAPNATTQALTSRNLIRHRIASRVGGDGHVVRLQLWTLVGGNVSDLRG
jgi:hypothetical protein